jgi:RimJ/RimL family protein N-acetyltransferase
MEISNSERLKFRLMDATDRQALWQIDQDPLVMKFLNGGTPSTKDEVNSVFLPRMQKYRNTALGWGIWQVLDKYNNEYLGWVLIRPMAFFTDNPQLNDLEIGWRFFRHTWGNGFATEAAEAIQRAVVSVSVLSGTEVTHISALAVADNLASIAVMKRMGMRFVKSFRHTDPIGDWDAVHYQMSVSQ